MIQSTGERALPQVCLIENRENAGLHTKNPAMQQCTGKYILLLNPDILVAPGALSVHSYGKNIRYHS